MMKKIFTYITALIALAACTNDENIVNGNNTGNLEDKTGGSTVNKPVVDGRYVEVETLIMDEELMSRSSLYYLYSNKNTVFSWAEGDQIGVFPVAQNTNEMDKPDKKSQAIYNVLGGNSSELRRKFEPAAGTQPIASSTEYVACHPTAVVGKQGYTDIPFSYLGQVQSSPVEMCYYPFSSNANADVEKYIDSEKNAASLLSQRDYLASHNQTTTELANIIFEMKRMGAVVRFYIKAPNDLKNSPAKEIVYENLQLANATSTFPGFVTDGDIDLSDWSFKNVNRKKVISLSFNCPIDFNGDETIDDNGLDMTLTSKCVYNKVGYIVAYMMMAPIDLTLYDGCILYLVGHKKDNKDAKYYYKATNLAKPNLTPNKFYQWTISNADEDTPIEFTPITVEEWREGTTFTNDGKGTETW